MEAENPVPTPLRAASDGRTTVPAIGGNVGTALREFARLDRSIGEFLFHPDGRLRRSNAIFVNGVDVRNLEGEETTFWDGDQV